MPKSITPTSGNPHNSTPPNITLSLDAIKQLEGLYCLNDLHRLSGGLEKDKPSLFFQTDHAKGLLAELEKENQAEGKPQPYIIRVIGKGKPQGTYVCRELVYAYANWISPSFYLCVIRTFDRVITSHTSYTAQINAICHDLKEITECLSKAGRFLSIGGKQAKPAMLEQLQQLLDNQQLSFLGSN